jgi:hypothetical protein
MIDKGTGNRPIESNHSNNIEFITEKWYQVQQALLGMTHRPRVVLQYKDEKDEKK